MSPRGRRPGSPDTRAAVLDAARTAFASSGYAGTTVRRVATDAGVDPALVHHYFGSKADLFVASLALPVDPRSVLAPVADGPLEEAGERLMRVFCRIWGDPATREPLLALARGIVDPEGQRLLREGFLGVVLAPLGVALGVDRPDVRMPLVASQVVGLIVLRHLVQVEPIASLDDDALVAAYAPTLQRYLTGPLPPM